MRRLVAAAALLTSLVAAPLASAQERDLRTLTGSIDGLTRDQLDAVVAERWACRQMVVHLYDLSEAFSIAASGGDRAPFDRMHAGAETAWRYARATCDQMIASVSVGWPRAVMDSEFKLIGRLRVALMAATTAYADEKSADEINAALDGYQAVLAEWVAWLELSGRFWAGELLAHPDRSCLGRSRGKASALRGRLWELSLQDEGRETAELRVRLEQLQRDVLQCETTTSLEEVERTLLNRTLEAYAEALAALEAGDDVVAARAMEREQELTSRGARCRSEHAGGEVSPECSGGQAPVDGR